MTLSLTFDWYVTGYDPGTQSLLVHCRTTKQTGTVADPTEKERMDACAKNFQSYAWTHPERVTIEEVPEKALMRARDTQRLSGHLKFTPQVSRHVE